MTHPTPTPGSFDASRLGCSCDPYLNQHGRGCGGALAVRQYLVNAACPVHGDEAGMRIDRRRLPHRLKATPSPIADARIAAGFTTTELAAQLGVTSQAVTNWEQGRCGVSGENRRKLAHVLRTSVDVLFGLTRPRRRTAGNTVAHRAARQSASQNAGAVARVLGIAGRAPRSDAA
jgi:transcriptional regulator with XRE-family HTH domain